MSMAIGKRGVRCPGPGGVRKVGAMASPTLRELLSGKRFGLVLSAGYFGFYGHAGFLQALESAGLAPAAYAGTSAGGLVAAYAAAGLSPDAVADLVLAQRRQHFWDPDPVGAVVGLASRGPGFTGLLKGGRFRKLLDDTLPVRTFEALPTPLVLVGCDLTRGEPAVFASGELAPRVHATCAYPGLFRAVSLDGRLFWDGGLVDKAPALALADSRAGGELEALLVHYLPSRARGLSGGLLAYAQGVATGTAALRHDHFRLQLRVLRTRGLPVYVVTSELPAVSPAKLEAGQEALRVARDKATEALTSPPPEAEAQAPGQLLH